MCMNCGCGESSKRHQDTDITREDIERAAEAGGLTVEQVSDNLRTSLDRLQQDRSADTAR